MFKEVREGHLNAPSALKIGGRFKHATPVTLCAFKAIFLIFCLIHIFVEWGEASDIRQIAINYKARRKPSRRES